MAKMLMEKRTIVLFVSETCQIHGDYPHVFTFTHLHKRNRSNTHLAGKAPDAPDLCGSLYRDRTTGL